MEYKDIEKLVNEAEKLYQNTQEGYVQDSDTILKDLVDEAYDGDYTRLSLEIFKTWKTAQNDSERKLVEEMFIGARDVAGSSSAGDTFSSLATIPLTSFAQVCP